MICNNLPTTDSRYVFNILSLFLKPFVLSRVKGRTPIVIHEESMMINTESGMYLDDSRDFPVPIKCLKNLSTPTV